MRLVASPLLLAASTIAFPHFAQRRDGGAPPDDPNLISSIIDGIEDETGPDGSQGPAPLDPLAPLLGAGLPRRDLIGGLLQPLTGILAAIDVPTPQSQGLAKVPDDAHPYIAPRPTDVRGLCPTLNTLANHGYISRDGITTFAEAANAIQTAYSISFDLAAGLSVLGLLAGGDLVSGKYSIGGADSRVPNTIGPALGLDSHGRFEEDVSPSRGDTYFGDNHDFNLTRWNQLVDYTKEFDNGLFSFDTFKQEVAIRWDQSQATNPEFFSGIKQFIVRYAVRILTYRPLANGTTPDQPDYANISPFFLNETFPENWYRRAEAYSFVDLAAEVAEMFLYAPKPFGQNVNGVFVPSEIQVPTAPQDIQCFFFSAFLDLVPDQLAPEFLYVNEILTQILKPLVGGNCNNTDFADESASNNNALIYNQPHGGDGGSGSGIPLSGS